MALKPIKGMAMPEDKDPVSPAPVAVAPWLVDTPTEAPTAPETPAVTDPAPVVDAAPEAPAADPVPEAAQPAPIVPAEPEQAPTPVVTQEPIEVASEVVDTVTVTVPRDYKLRISADKLFEYKAGVQEMERWHAEHWYSKANGVVIYKR